MIGNINPLQVFTKNEIIAIQAFMIASVTACTIATVYIAQPELTPGYGPGKYWLLPLAVISLIAVVQEWNTRINDRGDHSLDRPQRAGQSTSHRSADLEPGRGDHMLMIVKERYVRDDIGEAQLERELEQVLETENANYSLWEANREPFDDRDD